MATRTKLTEKAIAKLVAPDPSGKPKIHWDTDLRGFGVLCSGTTNSRSFVAQRDLPDGRSRRVTVAKVGEVKLEEARRRAAEKLDAMRQGVDPKARPREELTLRRALDDYLARNKRLRPKSREDYRASMERNLAAWLDRPLASITREAVEARHRKIAEEVAARGRHNGESSANGAMRVLRLIYNDAADRDPTLPPNPVRLRKSWFPAPRRTRMVPLDRLPDFVAAVRELPNKVAADYLLLLLHTGLRRREAASLTWGDIDLATGVIRLPAARTKAGRKLDLPMTSFVGDLLVARRALGDGGFVFPANGRTGHIAEPKFALRAVARATGIEVSPHDLRRTYITVAEGTDISPLALKALVNHALGDDVTAGYVQMGTERLREPAEKVCARIVELSGGAPEAGGNVVRLA